MLQVKLASVSVRDQDLAIEFFRDKLGFELTTDAPMGEVQRWVEVTPPGGGVRIVLSTMEEDQDLIGRFSNIIFGTDNVQREYEELLARGVEFLAPPQTEFWGTYVIFKDIDGNQFLIGSEVQQEQN
jgi:uncharacterized glyoxalase superfamily protein PhnB